MKLEDLDDEDLKEVDKEYREEEFRYIHIIYAVDRDKVLVGNGVMKSTERKVRSLDNGEWEKQELLKNFKLPRPMFAHEVKEWKQEQLKDEESELSKVLESVKERNNLD